MDSLIGNVHFVGGNLVVRPLLYCYQRLHIQFKIMGSEIEN